MPYIDSNVFFYAKIRDRRYGDACAAILEDIANGGLDAWISTLVVVEVANAVRKYGLGREVKDMIDAICSLDIHMCPLDEVTVRSSADVFSRSRIGPYDCVHAATMLKHGLKDIISADADFDRVAGLKRTDPLTYVKKS